jgi:uncharacterized membrane protein
MAQKHKKPKHGKQAQTTNRDTYANKKAVVLKQGPNKSIIFSVLAGLVIVLAGGFFYFSNQPDQRTAIAASASANKPSSDGTVVYPVAMFADGKARHFEHAHQDLTIRYFILKSSDGVIRAAFDACDVCWPAGKGYYQDGDDMICRNCGRRFASVGINEIKGGCNPAPLTRKVEGDQLVIQVKDIIEGKSYFNFSGKA